MDKKTNNCTGLFLVVILVMGFVFTDCVREEKEETYLLKQSAQPENRKKAFGKIALSLLLC